MHSVEYAQHIRVWETESVKKKKRRKKKPLPSIITEGYIYIIYFIGTWWMLVFEDLFWISFVIKKRGVLNAQDPRISSNKSTRINLNEYMYKMEKKLGRRMQDLSL